MKRIIILLFLCGFFQGTVYALTQHEIDMFKKLRSKWTLKEKSLLSQRDRLKAGDPAYTKLTSEIVKASYWIKYYGDAQIDKSTMWNVIKNTVVWSAQDLAETGSIMWNRSENLVQKAFEGKWADLMKDAADSLMRQKIRTIVRGALDGRVYTQIEDHIFNSFISPKIEKNRLHQYAETAFGKTKDKLKDAYVDELKRQAASRSKAELEVYAGKLAARVGGAVDAGEFTVDMVQKYVMWNEAQRPIAVMLDHIKKIQAREKCSYVKAFNIYMGKEKITAVEKKETPEKEIAKKETPAKTSDGNPLAFHPNYVDLNTIDRRPPSLKDALKEIPSSWTRKPFISPSQCYDSFVNAGNKPTGAAILYYNCTSLVKHVTFTYTHSNYFKCTHFHKNQKVYIEEHLISAGKRTGITREWDQSGVITHWMNYKNGALLTDIHFTGGKPYVMYLIENGKKAGSMRISYDQNSGRIIEVTYMYKGKLLKMEKY